MSVLLQVEGLSKSYGMQVGCADVGFDIHAGEVLGIVGSLGPERRPFCVALPAS